MPVGAVPTRCNFFSYKALISPLRLHPRGLLTTQRGSLGGSLSSWGRGPWHSTSLGRPGERPHNASGGAQFSFLHPSLSSPRAAPGPGTWLQLGALSPVALLPILPQPGRAHPPAPPPRLN